MFAAFKRHESPVDGSERVGGIGELPPRPVNQANRGGDQTLPQRETDVSQGAGKRTIRATQEALIQCTQRGRERAALK